MTTGVGNILSGALARQVIAAKATARVIDDIQQKLASGLSVNSAIDDPKNFFSAQALQNRADDIARRLDGIGQSIRAVQVAENGVQEALKIIDLAESYLLDVEKGILTGEITFEPTGPPTNQTLFTPSAGDFLGYAGGQDSGGPVTVTNGGETFNITGNLWKRVAINYTVTADTVLEFDFRSGTIPEIAAIGFDNDTNFGNDSNRFFLYGTQTSGITYAAPTATYQYDGSGNVVHVEIPVGTFFTGTFSHITFINDDDSVPTGESEYSNLFLREGPLNNTNEGPAALQEEYEAIVSQLDFLAIDAQYRGINLLKGEELTTVFNESGSSRLISEGIDATTRGLGLNVGGFNSLEDVQNKIEEVRDAKALLRSFGSSLSHDLNIIKTRQSFTRDTINALKAGSDDLTVDDANQAGAEFLATQVRQQIQFSALAFRQTSIANFI